MEEFIFGWLDDGWMDGTIHKWIYGKMNDKWMDGNDG